MDRRIFLQLLSRGFAGTATLNATGLERHPAFHQELARESLANVGTEPTSIRLTDKAWPIGTLDPARNLQSEKLSADGLRLERIKIPPVYAALIRKGDAGPSDYDNFQVLSKNAIQASQSQTVHVAAHPTRREVTLFLDFGRTLPGTLEFEADLPLGSTVEVEFGEAMQPTRWYSVQPAPDGTLRVFRPQIAHGGWGSLRFAWIRVGNVTREFTFRTVSAVLQILPATYLGSFECSNDDLARVWEMCAYTAHAVMAQPGGDDTTARAQLQTLCLDRIDRHPWAGDSRVIQRVVSRVFGHFDLLRDALEQSLPSGTRPIPDLQGVPPYTLDWGLALIDYYRTSGDEKYFRSRIRDLAAIAEKYQSGPPQGGWLFFDWDPRIISPYHLGTQQPEALEEQAKAAFAGKYVQFCREFATAAAHVKDTESINAFGTLADATSSRWLADHPRWSEQFGIHAITQLLLGGILKPEHWNAAYARAYADPGHRWTNTPYFALYVLDALALMDRNGPALNLIQTYWGSMIAAGATTTWEEWSPDVSLPTNAQPPQYGPPSTWGGLSLIQAAGAGPAAWLIENVAGINPETPGYKRVLLRPTMADLQWAAGTAATPLGPVTTQWETVEGGLRLRYKVPKEADGVTLELPRGYEYHLGGKVTRPSGIRNGRAVIMGPSGENFVTLHR